MNKRNIVVGVIVVVLVLAGIVYFVVSKPGPQEEIVLNEKITLNAAPEKSAYTMGEEVRLTLHLSNAGNIASCVSDMVEGNIRIVSLTRNGEEVATRSAPISFIEKLSLLLEKSLTVLQPGESLDIAMSTWVDPGLEKRALRTVALSGSGSVATFYEMETPGEYDLTLVYEYPGTPPPDCPSVFREETNPSGVTFTVTP